MSKELLVDLFDLNEDSEGGRAIWEYQDQSQIPKEILNESKVDNVHIIGRVVGEMFAVNGKSGNKRFYARKLWENALSKTKSTMNNGMMFGTIGHKQPIDEKAILEGKISHRVSRLWIDESTKKGMGEILILGTDSGRNLNALLKSGAKFPVSSRAFGEYSGKTDEGLDIVNPDTYELIGFDFVINPGISSAIPNVVESLNQSEKDMSDNTAVLTQLTEEKIQLGRELTESKATVESLKGRAELAESRLETSTGALAKYQAIGTPEDLKSISETFNEVNTAKLTLEGQVVAYKYLGTPEEIEEAMNSMSAIQEEYKALGTPEEIGKCLEALAQYIKLGKTQVFESQAAELTAYKEIGTAEEIAESLDAATVAITAYKELGTVAEIEEVLDTLERYADLGSPAEVQEALERSLAFVEGAKNDRKKLKNESLAKELGVPVEILESFDGKSEDEIQNLIKTIKGTAAPASNVSERYRVAPNKDAELNEDNKGGQGSPNEMNESRASRLAARFNS